MTAPITDLLGAYPRRSALFVAVLLVTGLLWHWCLPGFYANAGAALYLRGPLPAVAGVALALWLYRDAPAWLQGLAGCAAGLLVSLLANLVLGLCFLGIGGALHGTWAQLTSCFYWPLQALWKLWGDPHFVYALWSGLLPLLLWGALAFAAVLTGRPATRGHLGALFGGFSDRRAFSAAQKRQMHEYRQTYLAAVRGGEAPPPVPPGLVAAGTSGGGLAQSYYVLKIGLAVAGALGLAGGAWSLLGDALRGPLTTIFWRGLVGGG